MRMVIIPVIGLLLGLAVGMAVNIRLPIQYAAYLSVAILAALDTVFGGIKSGLQHEFDHRVFLTGFFFQHAARGSLGVHRLAARNRSHFGGRGCLWCSDLQ